MYFRHEKDISSSVVKGRMLPFKVMGLGAKLTMTVDLSTVIVNLTGCRITWDICEQVNEEGFSRKD